MTSTSAVAIPAESDAPGAADDDVFLALESAHGDALKPMLAACLKDVDVWCERLRDAIECAYWQEAVRVALRIGHETERLGFLRPAVTARRLADATYHADHAALLRAEAQLVVFECGRFRLAIAARYPEFIASVAASVA
jgi:hypothetical protein